MKNGIFVFALLLAACLMVGAVSAATATTEVTATIVNPGDTITIEAPAAFAWNLDMLNPNNNQVNIGNVHILSNIAYVLSVAGSHKGHMATPVTFLEFENPVLVYNGVNFLPTDTEGSSTLPIYNGVAGTKDVPVHLQQVLTTADAGKTGATITLTFTAGSL